MHSPKDDEARKCIDYVDDNRARMRYAEFRAAGLCTWAEPEVLGLEAADDARLVCGDEGAQDLGAEADDVLLGQRAAPHHAPGTDRLHDPVLLQRVADHAGSPPPAVLSCLP